MYLTLYIPEGKTLYHQSLTARTFKIKWGRVIFIQLDRTELMSITRITKLQTMTKVPVRANMQIFVSVREQNDHS